MAALAVLLVALLVVQAPVAMADRVLHSTGHDHAPNVFAGAVFDLPDHDHDRYGADAAKAADQDNDPAPAVQTASDDAAHDASGSGSHHHHHDAPTIYGLAGGMSLPSAWSSSSPGFRLGDNLRNGTLPLQQERPPKAFLDHVA